MVLLPTDPLMTPKDPFVRTGFLGLLLAETNSNCRNQKVLRTPFSIVLGRRDRSCILCDEGLEVPTFVRVEFKTIDGLLYSRSPSVEIYGMIIIAGHIGARLTLPRVLEPMDIASFPV